MSDKHPMPNVEDLHKMTGQDLNHWTDYYFKLSEDAGDHAFFPLRAQIFMQEMARRSQDRQTKVMLKYTERITLMTLVILLMTALMTVPVIRSWIPISSPLDETIPS